ncbi:hypothetical protein [Roseicella aerolata]|uniref:Uncharacterized protein n=1 Tax=Roseicella aerolata TaxID=2883479 RepID=A0A9X1IHB6_9PROT|nr:hypothetical protein [Roseicella aerolata]MCB4824577.1 hypothetical protein [Roseicella aerolata]
MDRLGVIGCIDTPWDDDIAAERAMSEAPAIAVATIPGGRVEQRQCRDGAQLRQTVEIRRHGGPVWTAYARRFALPADPGEAERATGQATHVLALFAQAMAAADTAREARSAMLAWDAPEPPWAAQYG